MFDIDRLNYAALDEPLTAADKQQFRPPRNMSHLVWVIFGSVFCALLFLLITSMIRALLAINGVFSIGSWLPPLILCVIAGLIAGYYIRDRRRKIRLRKFAAQNNLKFVDSTHPVPSDGAIFLTGDSRGYTEGFETPDGSLSCANYQYTIGSGKNRRTVQWGVMRATLSRKLPNVVLDATSNNTFGRFSNLPASFKGGQKFELEGNFNQAFSVYAPMGYQRDALYFLTPELMEVLVNYGAAYDFEVIDNNLFIYKNGAITFDKNTIPQVFQTIKYFGWQFEDNVKRYNDDRVVNATALNVVGGDGVRLKRKFAWVSVVAVVVFILLQLLQFIGR